METQDKLITYINTELLNGRTTVYPEEDLLGAGMLDSMAMMWLITFIEEDFALKIPPEDLTIENFRTVEAIDAYLKRRNGG